eukprot:SAG31_NODE_5577_length_2447_cov_1.805366_3_plen_103_part_00
MKIRAPDKATADDLKDRLIGLADGSSTTSGAQALLNSDRTNHTLEVSRVTLVGDDASDGRRALFANSVSTEAQSQAEYIDQLRTENANLRMQLQAARAYNRN